MRPYRTRTSLAAHEARALRDAGDGLCCMLQRRALALVLTSMVRRIVYLGRAQMACVVRNAVNVSKYDASEFMMAARAGAHR